jgi:hypothetical protein
MSRKEGVINTIFRLLDMIENDANHSIVAQIRGLLNELRNS